MRKTLMELREENKRLNDVQAAAGRIKDQRKEERDLRIKNFLARRGVTTNNVRSFGSSVMNGTKRAGGAFATASMDFLNDNIRAVNDKRSNKYKDPLKHTFVGAKRKR